jgi:roundabout axon guidance receptor 2
MTRPRDLRLGLNQMARFECSADGNPSPTLYWRKEGSQELFFPSSSGTEGHWRVSPEGTLELSGVRKEDSGTWVCGAVSAAGAGETVARLEVTSADQLPPPIINVEPKNQTLPLKSMASIPCYSEPGGSSGPTIKWLKDGTELLRETSDGTRITVSTNGTLQINGKSDVNWRLMCLDLDARAIPIAHCIRLHKNGFFPRLCFPKP